jgi:hypothetical protein
MPRSDYANNHSLVFHPKNPSRFYFDSFKTAFDHLYAEGAAKPARTVSVDKSSGGTYVSKRIIASIQGTTRIVARAQRKRQTQTVRPN